MCRTAKSYRIARACSGPKIVLLMAGYALYSVSDRPLGSRPRLGSPRAQPGHDDQSASTKRSRASNRTNKHDRRGVLRYPGTMRIQPDCDDDSQPVIVPRNDKPLVAVKPDRAHRLREHLIKVIRELRTEKRWARSVSAGLSLPVSRPASHRRPVRCARGFAAAMATTTAIWMTERWRGCLRHARHDRGRFTSPLRWARPGGRLP